MFVLKTAKYLPVFILFFLIAQNPGMGQNGDSIVYVYDTVVLKKSPTVIHKTIYIIEEPVVPHGWSTEISAGTFFLNRTYSPVLYDFNEISTIYQNAHRGLFGYNIEVVENYYNKSLLLQVGLGYRESRERFNYSVQRISAIDTLPGNIIDTTWTSTNYNSINKYHYLELPVKVGYTFQKGTTTYFIKAGVIFGYLATKTGYYIKTKKPYLVESLKKHGQLNPFTVSSLFSLEIIHNFSNNTSVIAEPFLVYNFTSLYDKNYVVVTRNNNIGVKLGMVFHIK